MSAVDFVKVTPAELDAMVLHHCDWVSRCLASESDEEWMPQLEVLAKPPPDQAGEPQTIMHALNVDFNDRREKYLTMRRLGIRFYRELKLVPVAAVMSSEAWLGSPRHVDDTRPQVQPKDDPDRREVLSVFGGAIGQAEARGQRALITRGAGNGIVLGEWSKVDGATSNLIAEFYRGFFQDVGRKVGVEL